MASSLYQTYLSKYSQPATRKQLVRWASWFFCVNTLLLLIVSLRYFIVIDFPNQPIAQAFNVFAFIGHFAFLGFLGFLLVLPVILLLPSRPLITTIANTLAVALIVIIIIDTFVFAQYRFHLNSMVFSLVFGGAGDEIFHFSTKLWMITLGGLLLIIAIEFALSRLIWRWIQSQRPRWLGVTVATSLTFIFLAQHLTFAWADAKAYIPITKQIHYLPAYFPLTAKSFFGKFGVVTHRVNVAKALTSNNTNIDYPKTALQCQSNHNPANLILIVLDSWRADKLTTEVTPNISEFAKNSMQFTNHYSGANSTRIGIFTLFYGIPGTYWQPILAENRGAALINEFVDQNYQMGIFASAKLNSPEFDRTVFARVNNLRIRSKGSSPQARDRNITDEFKIFIDSVKDSEQPFFGFLFYDSPHAYDFPKNYPLKFQPSWNAVNYFELNRDFDPTPFVNRYKNSIHYVDSLVGEVLQKINESGILKDTVVIITSDHGQEFNDNGQNYWGHNGNFSEYQTKVPLVIKWPGKQARTYSHLTSHFDIAPTLLKDLLLCNNDIADYSVGKDLLDNTTTPYLILSSYNQYAIRRTQGITVVDSFGQMDNYDPNYFPSNKVNLPPDVVMNVMEEMSYFYKK